MNCDKFRENISYYIDDILDDNDKSAFENHMNNCEKCKCEYEQMIILIDSLNSVEQVPLPDNYDETLRNKLKNEKVKAKRKWSKYMYIAASLAIVFFSVQNIDKFERIDIQENPNIEINENANKDVQQSPSAISDSENNNVDKRDIVDRVSDNEKANTDVQQSPSTISDSENTEGENDNVEKRDAVDKVSDNEKTNTDVQQSPSVISDSENTEDENDNVEKRDIVDRVSDNEKTNTDVQQSPSVISDSENTEGENDNVEKRDVVDRVSDNEKTNTDVQQSPLAISDSENTENENDNVDKRDIVDEVSDNEKTNTSVPTSVEDQEPIENTQPFESEKNENNMMGREMDSDEPSEQNNFSMNNEYQKNIKVGDAFDIMLENSKGTKYSMIYEDEKGLIELISKSISEGEEIYSSTWGFRASKEGTINIIYTLHNENDENDVYDEIVYEINIQE